LAGAFRVAEAVPGLAKWVGLVVGSPAGSTLAERVRLDPFPAGKALAQIGEPASPVLAETLARADPRERWVAYRALILIGSTRARTALCEHLDREPDSNLRLEMKKPLEDK
jgi:HEAT repeat protein